MVDPGSQGSLGPLAGVEATLAHLDPRTSDPASTDRGDLWYRTDVGGSYGALRVDTGSDVVSIPLVDAATATPSALRMPTPGGLGAVELADPSSADHPYIEVQTGSGPLAATGTLSDVSVTNGLITRYAFEDDGDTTTAVDSVGTNDGTISGATYDSESQVGALALRFDGSGDIVDTPLNYADYTSGITVSVWTKQDDILERGTLFGSGNPGKPNEYLRFGSDADMDWGVFDGSFQGLDTPTPTGNGEWNHIAATYDGSEYRLYGDGRLIAQATDPFPTNSIAESIGTRAGDGDKPYGGLLDDFRLYDRALSQSEIRTIVSNGGGTVWDSAQPDRHRLAHYRFDDAGDTTTATDETGVNDGIIVSGSYVGSGTVGSDSLSFDGSNTYVDPGFSPPDTCSFSVWVRPDNLGASRDTILGLANGATSGIYWEFDGSAGDLRFATYNGGYQGLTGVSGPWSNGSWTHLVAIWDDGYYELHADDTQLASTSDGFVPGSDVPYIGSLRDVKNGGESNHFAGDMDDFRVYPRRISDAEITALYNTGS